MLRLSYLTKLWLDIFYPTNLAARQPGSRASVLLICSDRSLLPGPMHGRQEVSSVYLLKNTLKAIDGAARQRSQQRKPGSLGSRLSLRQVVL